VPASSTLPNDVATLKRLVLERDRQIEHLKLQLARMRRWKFGASSEAIERAGQMPLTLEELQAVVGQNMPRSAAEEASSAAESSVGKTRPVRRQRLPEHFERDEKVIEAAESACAECGGELKQLGEPDASEVLEAKTVTFTVTRYIRPKKRCCKCARIVQAPARSRPIEKSFAGPSLLALVLTWKYGFHRVSRTH
jgi:transposase